MDRPAKLYKLANQLAKETEGFFEVKGPGEGNRATNRFITSLGALAKKEFGEDCSEKNISGENGLAVDFYFPQEGVIVEVALGLKKPNSEYEKDILKAVMAKDLGHKVKKLLFFAKPGGQKKCNQPGRTAVRKWLLKTHRIDLEVLDLG